MQNEDLQALLDRIQALERQQFDLKLAIDAVKIQARNLSKPTSESSEPTLIAPKPAQPTPEMVRPTPMPTALQPPVARPVVPKKSSDFERLIGENIANKVGMAIIVLGVAIGVKYAIDHELLSPLMRIVLGYLTGVAILGVSMRLRKDYFELSAVLLSGALAIFYFITFFAYDYYHLFPQWLAFLMMVLVTVFAAVSALNYDKMIIAIGGMVGAYAVPLLLSSGADRSLELLAYVLMINVGILYLSFKRNWNILYYLAFGFTWLIYFGWYVTASNNHEYLALLFSSLYFALFYTAFMVYKVIRNQQFNHTNIFILAINALFYYGAGMLIISQMPNGNDYTGLFTLLNAVVHFGVSRMIYQRQLADKSLFLLVSGLVILFVTLVFPVQFSGFKVTMFWAMEMGLLYFIGQKQGISAYKKLSYPLMLLTLGSLVSLWSDYNSYDPYNTSYSTFVTPILNSMFFSTAITLASFVFMFWTYKKYNKAENQANGFEQLLLNNIVPVVIVILSFFLFYNEIGTCFDQAYTSMNTVGNFSIIYDYKSAVLLIYTMLFVSILNILIKKYTPTTIFINALSLLNLWTILIFITKGLSALSALKYSYFYPSDIYTLSILALVIRYVALAVLAFMIYTFYNVAMPFFVNIKERKSIFDLIIYGTTLVVLSTEVVDWMSIAHSPNAYTFGLSILFGLYSLALIVYGIYAKRKHLRLGAIVLFAVTLLKLFLYDLSDADTITKTVLMVSLGLLLLIISFLYNKYKHIIVEDDEA